MTAERLIRLGIMSQWLCIAGLMILGFFPLITAPEELQSAYDRHSESQLSGHESLVLWLALGIVAFYIISSLGLFFRPRSPIWFWIFFGSVSMCELSSFAFGFTLMDPLSYVVESLFMLSIGVVVGAFITSRRFLNSSSAASPTTST